MEVLLKRKNIPTRYNIKKQNKISQTESGIPGEFLS
jgi:hypothetical protein